MKKLFFLLFGLLTVSVMAQTVSVTFQVKMNIMMKKGLFSKTSDTVVVRGDFQADAGDPNGNWQGKRFMLTDTDGDSTYTLAVNLPSNSTATGKAYAFKFVKNSDGWESNPDRGMTVKTVNLTLPAYYFNNDSIFVAAPRVVNTLNFTADLSDILGTGVGFFDPSLDSIQVMGLDWDAGDSVRSGNRRLRNTPLAPTLFKTTMVVSGQLNDSVKWKFKAFPDARFTNTGWETGQDRWLWYQADNSVINLPNIKPSIYPTIGPLTADVVVKFQVNMTSARNVYNQQVINPSTIRFVGVKGGSVPIGNWGGNWVVADTGVTMMVLNDAGINGDVTAGDRIWSRNVVFPTGTAGGAIEYKYGCSYPGADTANGGSTWLDNEGGFGQNHLFTLRNGNTIVLANGFGNFTTDVRKDEGAGVPSEFALSQNYPNPFNPSTKFSYTIPADANVSLTVYNALGQEVATIFNGFQKAATYSVDFNASKLTSGIYFYTLKAGNYTATRKMTILK